MVALALHQFHQDRGARFTNVGELEVVADYGDVPGEYAALGTNAGLLDLSFRGRLCLTGADRIRFLHGQVTNDVKRLARGEGCYAALTNAKGRMQGDLNIYCLADELLLDVEPGLATATAARLEQYIVADDVQVVDVAAHYGLLSVQGPESEAVVRQAGFAGGLPSKTLGLVQATDAELGENFLVNQPRLGAQGFDWLVPVTALEVLAGKLLAAVRAVGGRPCGWEACEIARVEAGRPRYGADMDDSNLALECGIEGRAISYTKGCYIGQEVLNRVHTLGHVNRELRGLRLADSLAALPAKGDKLMHEGREAGYVTSAVVSPALKAKIALGYVRHGADQAGTELVLRSGNGESVARVVGLPFRQS